jgi:hypothetical protein
VAIRRWSLRLVLLAALISAVSILDFILPPLICGREPRGRFSRNQNIGTRKEYG